MKCTVLDILGFELKLFDTACVLVHSPTTKVWIGSRICLHGALSDMTERCDKEEIVCLSGSLYCSILVCYLAVPLEVFESCDEEGMLHPALQNHPKHFTMKIMTSS